MTTSDADANTHRTPGSELKSAIFVVIDTNIVLDMLLFRDSGVDGLQQLLCGGQFIWISTSGMLDELADVLTRSFARRWTVDGIAVSAQARTLCRLVVAPLALNPPAQRCADPDDQQFIDLACAWPATWLFSRDRALLNLADSARRRGVNVVTPAQWLSSMRLAVAS